MADNAIVRECNDVTPQTTRFPCSDETWQSMHSRRVPLTTVNPHTKRITVCGYLIRIKTGLPIISRYVSVYRDITEKLCTISTCGY